METPTCARCVLAPKCSDREVINEIVTSLLFELSERLPQAVQWEDLCESVAEWLEEAVAPECDAFVVVAEDGRACGTCRYHSGTPIDVPPCLGCFEHPLRPHWSRA